LKHNLDIFDEKVIEAYWIGNELLDNFNDAYEYINKGEFVLPCGDECE